MDVVECIFPSGYKAKLRHVCVSAIALNEKSEVLLIRRAPESHRGGFFTVPGGYLDRDEDTQQAVLRELTEESGYTGEIVSLFQITVNPHRIHEDRQNVDFVYVVKVIGGTPTLNDEATEIRWFSPDDLPPEDEFAFDHHAIIKRYFDYLKNPFPLPQIV